MTLTRLWSRCWESRLRSVPSLTHTCIYSREMLPGGRALLEGAEPEGAHTSPSIPHLAGLVATEEGQLLLLPFVYPLLSSTPWLLPGYLHLVQHDLSGEGLL